MKINRISYRNFKSNIEETIFDFSSDKTLNVVKGENGCGKTTLIEAVSLAFFGRQIFNSNNYTNDYIKFVTSRLSSNSEDNYIEIKINFIDEGKEYQLRRVFEVNEVHLNSDNLVITHNDKVIESCPFIQKFNYEIVKRFFLDGEKIIELINNDKIIPFINEFIDTAFNLKTMKQVKSDLVTLQRKEFQTNQNTKHKDIEIMVSKQEKQLKNIKNDIKILEEKRDTFRTQVSLLENQIASKGFITKSEITKHITKKDELLTKRKSLSDKLKKFLINDIEYLMHKKVLKICVDNLNSTRTERLNEIVKAYENIGNLSEMSLPNSIELKLEYELCNKFAYVNDVDITKIYELLKLIKNNNVQITKVTNQLKKTEDGQKRLDLLDEHEESQQLLIKYSEQLKKQVEFCKELEIEYNNNKKILDKYNNDVLKNSININALNEQKKLNRVLEKYLTRQREKLNYDLSEKCTQLLRKYFLRKKDLIDGVKITDESINVYMNGNLVNYNNFSSGEKQMLIVGLIFAIIELSNLQTPLVLDSFVGRLDKKHTENILRYLIEHNKCQAILLATDDEFIKERYDQFKYHLGNVYSLFNEGYSAIAKEGYYEN